MALTEKGRHALELAIANYTADDWFSAKDLSTKCGETIAAATLTAICKNGYLNKKAGSPVMYALVNDAKEFLDMEPENVKKGCDKGNLDAAKKAKNDEFYTRYEDIEAECMKYKKYFKDKIILLPCDDHGLKRDNFWNFFVNNFEAFGLKKLIAVHYSGGPDNELGDAYKAWIENDTNNDGFIDDEDTQIEYLDGDGDFRSDECRELFKEADIIITNPPFSLFREFIAQIMEFEKQFLTIGPLNARTYKEIFPLIKDNKYWVGYNTVKHFNIGDGGTQDFGNICWYTNLPTKRREENLILTKTYNEDDYPKYDNYDAIEVNKVVNIPKDYYGAMGVPITFLDKYNPNQFEIIKFRKGNDEKDLTINGKPPYFRILIKRKS